MCTKLEEMLRNVLDRQQHEDRRETLTNASTPLRGGNMAYPRVRLMQKSPKLESIPLYTLQPNKSAQCSTSVSRDKIFASRPDNRLPPRAQHTRPHQCDRFIPSRRHQDFAASNYILTRVPPRAEQSHLLDVFDQISHLDTEWRKRLMKTSMEKHNLFPHAGQQRVLNIGKPFGGNRGNYRESERTIGGNTTDGVWKTKARQKPLIGLPDVMADVPTARNDLNRGLLDWGSTNYIATVIGPSFLIFDGSSRLTMTRPARVIDKITAKPYAIKWNHAGTMIALCSERSKIIIYHLERQKKIWSKRCRCTVEEPLFAVCTVLCVAWTQNDAEIVTGCSEGRLSSYSTSQGTLIDTIVAHAEMVLTVSISPDNRYLISSGGDKMVRVHKWPSFSPYLTIGYYEPIQATAWHPWEVATLCVGGGYEDGSLSLWDIHRRTCLGFRKVPFLGTVKNMRWNKLSGELVVQWNYPYENSARAVVPVLANFDRIVDLVTTAPRIMDMAWNPLGTRLALRMKNVVKIWNFFGSETSHWYDEKTKNKSWATKGTTLDGRTTNFENYTIR